MADFGVRILAPIFGRGALSAPESGTKKPLNMLGSGVA